MFHSFFCFLVKSKYLSIFSLLFSLYEQQNLLMISSFFFLINSHYIWSSDQDEVIHLYLKVLYSHDHLYKYICMQNHNDDIIKTSNTVLYKNTPLTLFKRVRKGYSRFYCERELETVQNCNILTPSLLAITAFLSRSPGLLNRGPTQPGAGFLYRILSPTATAQSGAWGPTLLGAGFLYRILSPTDWTSCALGYIIVQRPPFSCGRHRSHSFNPSTVKVIFWYSSTGCTCYLHRCISYFDSPAGSEVNIQQKSLRILCVLWQILVCAYIIS